MARRGKRIRNGFRLAVILVFLVILLLLLGIVMTLASGGSSEQPEAPTNAPASIEDFDPKKPQTGTKEEEKGSIWDKLSGALKEDKVQETEGQTFGIDVAR